METPQTRFGEWLRRQREARGWSLRDLASRSGLSHAYLRLIEYGHDPRSGAPVRPTVETLVAIASGLGMSPEEVILVYLDKQVFYPIKESDELYSKITIPVFEAVVARDPELRHTTPAGWATLELPQDASSQGAYFGVLAPDDSMAYGPQPIRKGWVCIVRRGPVPDGALAVVLVPGEEKALIRRINRQGRQIVMAASDPSVPPMAFPQTRVHILGEVIEVRYRPSQSSGQNPT